MKWCGYLVHKFYLNGTANPNTVIDKMSTRKQRRLGRINFEDMHSPQIEKTNSSSLIPLTPGTQKLATQLRKLPGDEFQKIQGNVDEMMKEQDFVRKKELNNRHADLERTLNGKLEENEILIGSIFKKFRGLARVMNNLSAENAQLKRRLEGIEDDVACKKLRTNEGENIHTDKHKSTLNSECEICALLERRCIKCSNTV